MSQYDIHTLHYCLQIVIYHLTRFIQEKEITMADKERLNFITAVYQQTVCNCLFDTVFSDMSHKIIL